MIIKRLLGMAALLLFPVLFVFDDEHGGGFVDHGAFLGCVLGFVEAQPSLNRQLQSRLFPNGRVAEEKCHLDVALASPSFSPCALPFGKNRLFADGTLTRAEPSAAL